MIPYIRVHPFDVALLQSAQGRAHVLELAQRNRWLWYVNEHEHTCPTCQRTIVHTGLAASIDDTGTHRCCGADVRLPLNEGAA